MKDETSDHGMRPVRSITPEICRRIDSVFTDIDDTLSLRGQIPAVAYTAIERATRAGISVVLVTGRPAGWCDHLARMWPVAAVVGENGALAFATKGDRMRRIYAPRRPDAPALLEQIRDEVLERVPGCKISADQPYREYDLAVDIAEEVDPLDDEAIDQIVEVFERYGATAKVSSIHVNGYFGDFDKLSMCKRCSVEILGRTLDPDRAIYVGDSPNDEPMFGHFPHGVGVANVRHMAHRMESLPTYVTAAEGGEGFAELIQLVLAAR